MIRRQVIRCILLLILSSVQPSTYHYAHSNEHTVNVPYCAAQAGFVYLMCTKLVEISDDVDPRDRTVACTDCCHAMDGKHESVSEVE